MYHAAQMFVYRDNVLKSERQAVNNPALDRSNVFLFLEGKSKKMERNLDKIP